MKYKKDVLLLLIVLILLSIVGFPNDRVKYLRAEVIGWSDRVAETENSFWLIKATKNRKFTFSEVWFTSNKFCIEELFDDYLILSSSQELVFVKPLNSNEYNKKRFKVGVDTLKICTPSIGGGSAFYFVIDTTNLGDSLFKNSSKSIIRIE